MDSASDIKPAFTGREFISALAKAQSEFPLIKANCTAVLSVDGSVKEYRYASLDHIIESIRKPLSDNGLTFMQLPLNIIQADGQERVGVETVVMHVCGDMMVSRLTAGLSTIRMQEMGGKLSYLCRYALKAMLGLSITLEDTDDGNATGMTEPVAKQEIPPVPAAKTLFQKIVESYENATSEEQLGTFHSKVLEYESMGRITPEECHEISKVSTRMYEKFAAVNDKGKEVPNEEGQKKAPRKKAAEPAAQ